MAIPRILFVIPGLLGGLLLPALTAPSSAPAGTVGMVSDDFAQDVVTIHVGQQLTFVNDSRFIHIIGPGWNTHLWGHERGVPMVGARLMQTNSVYTTGRWERPGRYRVTCSVHPHMNLVVVVVGKP